MRSPRPDNVSQPLCFAATPPKSQFRVFPMARTKILAAQRAKFQYKARLYTILINSELIDDIAMQILITSVAEVLIKHYIIYCSVCYVPKNLQVP